MGVRLLLVWDMLNMCCVDTALGPAQDTHATRVLLTAFLLDHVQQHATNSVCPGTCKSQINKGDPQNPPCGYIRRKKENLGKDKCLSVSVRVGKDGGKEQNEGTAVKVMVVFLGSR